MLHSIKKLEHCRILATDAEVGSVWDTAVTKSETVPPTTRIVRRSKCPPQAGTHHHDHRATNASV